MAIHAAVELMADRSPDAWLDKIRKVNPVYGEGYALIARFLVLNYRYPGRHRLLPQGHRSRIRSFGPRVPNWELI